MTERIGAERSDVDLVWPSGLIRPEKRLVYLDLNHWINLAKAATAHPDGIKFREAYEALRDRKDDWTYVISLPLIMELTGNLRRDQRRDIGQQIELFTGYSCILPFDVVAGLEFESALAKHVPIIERYEPIPLLGRGVMRAAGLVGGLRIRDKEGNDVTTDARLQAPGGTEYFDKRIREAELELNRGMVWGPESDEVESDLRRDGWDPSVARSLAEERAKLQREQADRLDEDSKWRRGRLRDLMAARYLAWEMQEVQIKEFARQGVHVGDVFSNPESARAFTDSMPSADVWITLMTAKHRSADSKWTPNDIFDTDAMAIAAPYCDIVVTERHVSHVLNQNGLPRRLGTKILTDLDQLAQEIPSADE